jgi:hypothetical protein
LYFVHMCRFELRRTGFPVPLQPPYGWLPQVAGATRAISPPVSSPSPRCAGAGTDGAFRLASRPRARPPCCRVPARWVVPCDFATFRRLLNVLSTQPDGRYGLCVQRDLVYVDLGSHLVSQIDSGNFIMTTGQSVSLSDEDALTPYYSHSIQNYVHVSWLMLTQKPISALGN